MMSTCFQALLTLFVSPENVATLFRATTLATMLMDQFMKQTATDYLMSVVRAPVQDILISTDSCEVRAPLHLSTALVLLGSLNEYTKSCFSKTEEFVIRCYFSLHDFNHQIVSQ